MIYPKFATHLNIHIPQAEVNVSGDFSSFYDMGQIQEKGYYNLNCYAAYSYGDQALISTGNMSSANTKRLLLINESFSDCVIPFLSLGVRHLKAMNLRHFRGSVRNFIDTEKPDAVIVQYHATLPGRFVHPISKYDEKMYDFR